MLEEALEHLVRGIVDNPDEVQVDLRNLRRGRVLEVRVHPDDLGKDEYWDHALVDLSAVALDGTPLGVVTDVLHPPGADLLVVRRPDGGELLVPFVRAIVPTVDLDARTLVVDPPEGLLEL